jgi:hypothetical protein
VKFEESDFHLTPHRNIPRGLNDRVPQAETEYFQGVKDLRIGSRILLFKPILLHGIFGCLEILRLRAKPFAQDDTLIIFVRRQMSANVVQTGGETPPLRVCGGWVFCTAQYPQMPFKRAIRESPLRVCGGKCHLFAPISPYRSPL